ncbi:FMN-dependent NADH-azoreductase [Pseudomonas syringae]|uniref:FMN-dependent NADH-azoreductase n=1 Tax=Pseudomonas syringae TaxID=317 RepID=UPI0006E577B6|nr:FMN-dependent NADH-azoreductase [Pseudomonas syringae]KPY39802.1 hypothetical protein ALO48_200045 [Pseudomonas syringae pv. rhaphiolepidis]KWS38693.1 FMN-dependent NADH-azoreductase [Pseudomonas syringae pv. rhaphiolepidis]
MSTNLLHLDSSILGANSVSRKLSASVVARLTETNPAVQVTYRDLAAEPIPHLSGAYLAAGQAGETQHVPALQADLALGSAVLEEFLAADIVVLGIGFYNFGIPSQLKAWVDRLAIAGKTFRYTEQGPVGLAGGKRVVLAIARGGFYGPGTPTASFEHAESYLRGIFAFFGIDHIEVVAAEGIAVGPEAREAAISQAEEKIAALHA